MPWITSRYNSECKECESEIEVGAVAYLDTDQRTHKIYCESCGQEMAPRKSVFATRMEN